MAEDLWVVGDPQGNLAPVTRVLRSNGIVDASGTWSAGTATLVVVGDLVDRGPEGLGVIDFLRRLQALAPQAGGRVVVLLGNHDILLLAARRFGGRFGGRFRADWLESGGVPRDLEGLRDDHVAWLTNLPAMAVEQSTLLMHADAMFYLDYGTSVRDVNAAFRRVLVSNAADAWERLLDRFSEHRAFVDPFGEANLERYLYAFGTVRVIHGHTPVPRMMQIAPETANAAYVYRGGRCVNVDPGIYLGGPGFAYQATPLP
jgi:hypothetical protein